MKPKPLTALNQTIFPRIAACLPFEGAPSARSWEPRVAGAAENSSAAWVFRSRELGGVAALLDDLISVGAEQNFLYLGQLVSRRNDELRRNCADVFIGSRSQRQPERAVHVRALAQELVDVVVVVRR